MKKATILLTRPAGENAGLQLRLAGEALASQGVTDLVSSVT